MIIETYTATDYFDSGPCNAQIDFNLTLTTRIHQLNKYVKKADADYICDSDNTPDWLADEDGDPWTYNDKVSPHEAATIHVMKDGVKWYSYLKGDDIQFYTDEIGIKEIEEIHKVLSTPRKLLPTLIGLESEEATAILEKRLKDGEHM